MPKIYLKTDRCVYRKPNKEIMSDQARIVTTCFYISILLMVIKQTHETFPTLF
jgi:hypothetical protein